MLFQSFYTRILTINKGLVYCVGLLIQNIRFSAWPTNHNTFPNNQLSESFGTTLSTPIYGRRIATTHGIIGWIFPNHMGLLV
jgi:hypothetical protein